MGTFTGKQNSPQKGVSTNLARNNSASLNANHHTHGILHLNKAIDDPEPKQLPQANTKISEANPRISAPPLFAHDFSRIPVYPQGHQSVPKEKEGQKTTILVPSLLRQLRQAYFSGQTDQATSMLQRSMGDGHQLPTTVMIRMNRHFGRDFSAVRVHTDEFSAGATKALDANAFTTGSDIAFAPGMFRPDTQDGQLRIAHELAHVIQQTGISIGQQNQLEQQADLAAIFGSLYTPNMGRVGRTIQREPTYPRRSTSSQMIAEARRVLSLTRSPSTGNETMRMWSNVPSNFDVATAGSIARRIWTYIFLRHFTETGSRPDVESSHPRYLYSDQYGWVDAQHFFGFIDMAEAQYQSTKERQQAFDANAAEGLGPIEFNQDDGTMKQEAFDAATAEGLSIEEKQQFIRDWIVLQQQQPARDATRLMQLRPPNTSAFSVTTGAAAARSAAIVYSSGALRGTQWELFKQLDERQLDKFFMDAAKSAFTYEDIVSNQLGIRFFFQFGISINAAPVAERESLFLSSLRSFFSSIRVESDQRKLDLKAQNLPTVERFEAPKTTKERERGRHPDLFRLP